MKQLRRDLVMTKLDQDWATNDREYTFAPVGDDECSVRATKHGDGMLVVECSSRGSNHIFSQPMPKLNPKGNITITAVWTEKGGLTLYAEGAVIDQTPRRLN